MVTDGLDIQRPNFMHNSPNRLTLGMIHRLLKPRPDTFKRPAHFISPMIRMIHTKDEPTWPALDVHQNLHQLFHSFQKQSANTMAYICCYKYKQPVRHSFYLF